LCCRSAGRRQCRRRLCGHRAHAGNVQIYQGEWLMDNNILPAEVAHWLIQASYFVAAVLFIYGLKQMSHPRTARSGIIWAGVGMVVATVITYLEPAMHNYVLMTSAILLGGV